MTALNLFHDAWSRCDTLTVLYGYLTANTTGALNKDEILRAEWVARVSALDLYVHELIFERLLPVFEIGAPLTPAANKFQIPLSVAESFIGVSRTQAAQLLDAELRRQLGRVTYQYPDAIADGIRMFSGVELWNAISVRRGNTGSRVASEARQIKAQLSLIIERRNKIAHEGDMLPSTPRYPWPISPQDVHLVRTCIEELVTDIDAVV